MGSGPTRVTSLLSLFPLCRSKHSHLQRCWGSGLQRVDLGGTAQPMAEDGTGVEGRLLPMGQWCVGPGLVGVHQGAQFSGKLENGESATHLEKVPQKIRNRERGGDQTTRKGRRVRRFLLGVWNLLLVCF